MSYRIIEQHGISSYIFTQSYSDMSHLFSEMTVTFVGLLLLSSEEFLYLGAEALLLSSHSYTLLVDKFLVRG